MAALTPAPADEASLWFVVFLVLLLTLSLAAVIVSPPPTDSPRAEGADDEPDRPQRAGPPWGPASKPPLPRRDAGQSGATPRGLKHPGGPPWGRAPKPPGVP
jgi:hypothetical protein